MIIDKVIKPCIEEDVRANAEAQCEIALELLYAKDYKGALNLYEEARRQGYDKAYYSLSLMHYYGLGVEVNCEVALKLYMQAPDLKSINNEIDKIFTPLYIYKGDPETPEVTKIIESAEEGDAEAQYELGLVYLHGKGVEQDDCKAFEYVIDAMENGHNKAQFVASKMYRTGLGVKEDTKQAFEDYREANEQRSEAVKLSSNRFKCAKEGIPYIEVTSSYEAVSKHLNDGAQVVLVDGTAGSGKTTFVEYLKQNKRKNIAIVAPTGIAALNVGGETINAFFNFPPKVIQKGDIRELRHKQQLFKNIDILIIDEISMVRADVLEAISESLKLNRGEPNKPFGGCQVVLIGDLYQLSPVAKGKEEDELYKMYKSKWFFSASCIKEISLVYVELKKNFRQKDGEWLDVLNSIRCGKNLRESIAKCNQLCTVKSRDPQTVTLTCRNEESRKVNEAELSRIMGQPIKYIASKEGSFGKVSEESLPVPSRLVFKVNARVMFRKNDPEKQWVNGTLGTIRKLNEESIEVELDGTDKILVNVFPETWERTKYELSPNKKAIVKTATGEYTQFPLQLAWAFTIHKAQGLTLPKVHIDLGNGSFAEGQTYVALSRCRKALDISLERPLKISDIRTDKDVGRFYNWLKADKVQAEISEEELLF